MQEEFGNVARALGANPTNREIQTLISGTSNERLSFEDFYPMWQSVIKMEEERSQKNDQDKIVAGFRYSFQISSVDYFSPPFSPKKLYLKLSLKLKSWKEIGQSNCFTLQNKH